MSEPAEREVEEEGAHALLWLMHHSPGRLRVRSVRFRGATPEAERVRTALDGTPGVARVSHFPTTGSLLVEYAPGEVEVEAILASAVARSGLEGVIDVGEARGRVSMLQSVVQTARRLDELSQGLTGAGLYELIPAALVATSLVSLVTRRAERSRLPRWDNALFWAYSLFREGLGANGP